MNAKIAKINSTRKFVGLQYTSYIVLEELFSVEFVSTFFLKQYLKAYFTTGISASLCSLL